MARSTFFKNLEILKDQKLIKVVNVNKRDHRLYPYTDLLISVPEELDEFKDAFFVLVERVKQYNKLKIEALDKNRQKGEVTDEHIHDSVDFVHKKGTVSDSIILLYQHLVGMCILAGIFIWPTKVNDSKAINKVYEVAFLRLQEIQQKLAELFPPGYNYPLTKKLVGDLFQLEPHKLDFVARSFYELGLNKQIEPVLDSLWEISNSSIPFSRYAAFPLSLSKGSVRNGKLVKWKEVLKIAERKTLQHSSKK
ncbi:MAG TPA: hypothetical protein VHH33_06515 [Nitrososphaeraceae archaeon]|nr:hypothetical protein [Nitrososphaeraceae archaeon]